MISTTKNNITYFSLIVIRLFVLFIFILNFSCKREKYNLLEVPATIQVLKEQKIDYNNVVFKDSNNNILKDFDLRYYNDVYGKEYYVDQNADVKEIRFRPITYKDRLVRIHIQVTKEEALKNIDLIQIDSSKVKSILTDVFNTDQKVRNTGSTEEIRRTDTKNRQIVISILEKYGFPKKEAVGEKGVLAVFLTIQHNSPELRAYYYPLFLEAAEKEDIGLFAIAMLEDRILNDYGFMQVYGTQQSAIEKLPIKDSLKVNERRVKMGLEPLVW